MTDLLIRNHHTSFSLAHYVDTWSAQFSSKNHSEKCCSVPICLRNLNVTNKQTCRKKVNDPQQSKSLIQSGLLYVRCIMEPVFPDFLAVGEFYVWRKPVIREELTSATPMKQKHIWTPKANVASIILSNTVNIWISLHSLKLAVNSFKMSSAFIQIFFKL